MNEGKIFEIDFLKSAEKFCAKIRLNDPASSFGNGGNGLRFSAQNICDAILYQHPKMYLIELKSHLGKSIPNSAIIRNKKDKRIWQMVDMHSTHYGISSLFVFNWRDLDNITVAVRASWVLCYIERGIRKSIPASETIKNGIIVPHSLKKTRYQYDVQSIL